MLFSEDDDRTALLGRDHHLMLERRAALALTADDFTTAFMYADRRCRIAPPPTSHCFVLRAQAAWRLGRHAAALEDLEEAIEIDPTSVAANRRALAWATDDVRLKAARRLIPQERDPAILRNAIAALREAGEQTWSACSVLDSHVTGWVAWIGSDPLEASVVSEDARLTTALGADPLHVLATRDISATEFRLHRPPSTQPQHLVLSRSGTTFLDRRLPANQAAPRAFRYRPSGREGISSPREEPCPPGEKPYPSRGEPCPPTVIVPVFDDCDATIACFESLLKAGPTFTRERRNGSKDAFRVLAVDDAAPDPALRRYLRLLADSKLIDLVVNPQNLGFIGSINRALAEVSQGDVILLNADTLVPPGFVERLAAAAHSQAEIATATPLSNNGDIFSFPQPGFVNPMPDYDEMVSLDRAAATANASIVVDTPTGIGFCLYVTRRCLDAVGGLSERFERGYLEDVDFCLRAREQGFRNVCAPSVYVAHHGSKSFKQQKRGLVLRNLGVLDERFPSFRKECLAFEAADPLHAIRSNLERAIDQPAGSAVLIAAGPGGGCAMAEARARQLAADGERVIVAARERTALRVKAFDGSSPQGTLLDLDAQDQCLEALRRLRPSRLEIIDPHVPRRLLEFARRLSVPIDLWITAELSLAHVDMANRLLAPTQAAAAFAKARLPGREPQLVPWPSPPLVIDELTHREAKVGIEIETKVEAKVGARVGTEVETKVGTKIEAKVEAKVLAVVPSSPSSRAWQTIFALATRFQQPDGGAVRIVVAGATADDQTLMAFPNVFVTGPVAARELGDLLAAVGASFVLTDFEHPLFGDPLAEAARTANRPVAFRDWSHGHLESREQDLALATYVSDAALANTVALWIARS
jgi:GT2 family glycosyltransferase